MTTNYQDLFNLTSIESGIIDDLVINNSVDATTAEIIGFGDEQTIDTNNDGKLRMKPGGIGQFSAIYVDDIYEYTTNHNIVVNDPLVVAEVHAPNLNGTLFTDRIVCEDVIRVDQIVGPTPGFLTLGPEVKIENSLAVDTIQPSLEDKINFVAGITVADDVTTDTIKIDHIEKNLGTAISVEDNAIFANGLKTNEISSNTTGKILIKDNLEMEFPKGIYTDRLQSPDTILDSISILSELVCEKNLFVQDGILSADDIICETKIISDTFGNLASDNLTIELGGAAAEKNVIITGGGLIVSDITTSELIAQTTAISVTGDLEVTTLYVTELLPLESTIDITSEINITGEINLSGDMAASFIGATDLQVSNSFKTNTIDTYSGTALTIGSTGKTITVADNLNSGPLSVTGNVNVNGTITTASTIYCAALLDVSGNTFEIDTNVGGKFFAVYTNTINDRDETDELTINHAQVTAAGLTIQDNIFTNKRRCFYKYTGSAVNVSASTDTEVPWNTEIVDNASIFSSNRFYQNASTLTSRYLVTGFVHVNTATATTNLIEVFIAKNGSLTGNRPARNTQTGTVADTAMNFSCIVDMDEGDYISVWIYSVSAVTIHTNTALWESQIQVYEL